MVMASCVVAALVVFLGVIVVCAARVALTLVQGRVRAVNAVKAVKAVEAFKAVEAVHTLGFPPSSVSHSSNM